MLGTSTDVYSGSAGFQPNLLPAVGLRRRSWVGSTRVLPLSLLPTRKSKARQPDLGSATDKPEFQRSSEPWEIELLVCVPTRGAAPIATGVGRGKKAVTRVVVWVAA
jgi:hypothetical protein